MRVAGRSGERVRPSSGEEWQERAPEQLDRVVRGCVEWLVGVVGSCVEVVS